MLQNTIEFWLGFGLGVLAVVLITQGVEDLILSWFKTRHDRKIEQITRRIV